MAIKYDGGIILGADARSANVSVKWNEVPQHSKEEFC